MAVRAVFVQDVAGGGGGFEGVYWVILLMIRLGLTFFFFFLFISLLVRDMDRMVRWLVGYPGVMDGRTDDEGEE